MRMRNGKLNAADKTFWIRDIYSCIVIFSHIRDIQKSYTIECDLNDPRSVDSENSRIKIRTYVVR